MQEALANVARHSHASKAMVELKSEKEADSLLCNMRIMEMDFHGDDVQKGIGLDSMRERIAAIDGTFHVQSEKRWWHTNYRQVEEMING